MLKCCLTRCSGLEHQFMNFENMNKRYSSKNSQVFVWMVECASIAGSCWASICDTVNALPLAIALSH